VGEGLKPPVLKFGGADFQQRNDDGELEINSPFSFSIPDRIDFSRADRFFTSALDFTGELLQELLQDNVGIRGGKTFHQSTQ